MRRSIVRLSLVLQLAVLVGCGTTQPEAETPYPAAAAGESETAEAPPAISTPKATPVPSPIPTATPEPTPEAADYIESGNRLFVDGNLPEANAAYNRAIELDLVGS